MKPEAKERMSMLKTFLLNGVLFFVPIGLTFFLLGLLYYYSEAWFGGIAAWLVRFLAPDAILIGPIADGHIPGLSLVLLLGLLLIVGAIASRPIGRQGLRLVDYAFLMIPVVSSIYSAARKVIDALGDPSKSRFQKAVWINWPGPNTKSLGFVTNEVTDAKTGENYLTVFIPTMPNPTTGFVVAVPAKEAVDAEMSVEEALKLCISVGVLAPHELPLTTTAK